MDIATTSPTPMGSGSHFTSLGRRTSARQALRRPPSRSQLSRSEANPSGAPSATTTAKDSRSHSQPQSQQYSTLNDSSDDEIPVPMKLSALTKALLNDSHASRASSLAASAAAAERPSSPPGRPASRIMTRRGALAASTTFSAAEDREQRRESVRQRPETRRHVRAGSAQLPSSRPSSPMRSGGENSPPQRKRVVRLSNTPGNGNGLQQGLRRSLSASTQRKRPESRERSEEKNRALLQQQQQPQPQPQQPQQHQEHQEQPASQRDAPADVNTPVVPVRTVRIAVGSSDKSRSGGSSGVSSRRSAGNSDQEMPEDPATVGRPQVAAPQSSMRIKRVAKVPGSFLSGPARRGRRRQSEEDAQEQGEGGDMMWSSQEPESQQAHEMEPALGEQPASSFVAASYRDFAASGSPVSAKDSARAAIRRQASQASLPGSGSGSGAKEQPERSHLELAYKILAPPANHVSMDGQDKENEAPPTFKRAKPASAIISEKDLGKPAQPLSVAMAAAPQQRSASPERKVLAPKSHNTPHRAAPPPPPKMSVVETATAAAGASATAQGSKKRQVLLRVNGRTYTRIDCIGRGGSSKVYRVSAENGTTLALKRVTLEKADENTVKGFKGEIDLLKRLHGVERVIQLIDHELNLEKQMLSVLMEAGELDFHTLLRSRQCGPEGARLDPVFIRYYWKEMLECVQAVHARDVVHSDLKPANFVLVKGRLKLIDFGIANAIQTEMTVNVHRETQVGTPSYMSPESLMDSNQYAFTSAHNGKFCVPPPLGSGYQKGMPKLMKLGKPSDVWSLGCILYQMVYGTPPFGKIANQMSRCQAIINWAYQIEFPETTEDGSRVPPSVIRTMRRCLNREQKERPTCDELLADSDPFLYPQEFDPSVYAAAAHDKVLPMTEELLSRIIQSVVQRCKERLPTEGEAISTWPNAYWASVRKAVSGAGNTSKS
ncbi:hypothetical protein QBC46DRAFT_420183 [Diplogelasinospora grovesii]|uniref:Protein kinase domain-containing protein n=1 Tax=Diplogelasinospora grovesii TaxID=303347 RepID=A0AAN6S0Q9_9PEZI|nr:hypothetical protein QBC46DRAFT_420183 [Diplogelasinospora grovesii]